MNIVVVGGTGLIGSATVTQLRAAGHTTVAASPSSGVDTTTSQGLREAVTGADVVIDTTNAPSWEDAEVMEFFLTSTQHLLEAEADAGVTHHIALSVVGTERMLASGYFRAKIVQESLIRSGPIPHTVVRATQFFEFISNIADSATTGDTIRLPAAGIRPIAASDVSAHLARTATSAPTNGIVEVAGPDTYGLDDVVRRVLEAHDDTRRVVTDPSAPYYGWVHLDDTTLLPAADTAVGSTHLNDWLTRLRATPR
jgi:uncharacterized protein YbjT (DUF2867 family)